MAIQLTTAAADRVRGYLAEQPDAVGLRVAVRKTGCSGFAYEVDLARDAGAEDLVFDSQGIRVIVPKASLPMLDGTDLTNNADPDGKKLFVEFVKAVQTKPNGAWVRYKWTKLGESDPTPKKSWVRKCKAKDSPDDWVVGSGTWY